MLNLISFIQMFALLLGMVTMLLTILKGVDVFNAVFRAAVVYAFLMLAGMVLQYFYVKISVKAKNEQLKAEAEKLKSRLEAENEAEQEPQTSGA